MMDDGFVVAAANNEIVVRNRGNVSSTTLRRVEMLPPSEVDECLKLLLQRHIGASREELIPSTARHFGYRTTSAQLREFINGRIDTMVGDGRVVENGGRLRGADSV